MTSSLMVHNIDLKEKEFHEISDLVYKHCGINLHEGKKELVRARLAKRLRHGNFETFSDYMKYVLNDPTGNEFSILIDTLSTNLTSFYRQPEHFEFLTRYFLPTLLKQKKDKNNHRIRAWSAGCSSGEEAYSIAITLLEAVEEHNEFNARVLATDISTRMLKTARKGIYEKKRVMAVPPMQRNKYLTLFRVNKQKLFHVGEQLKRTVLFEYLNLMENWPIRGQLDFIFCRNVMIYFDKATQQHLIDRFWKILDSGGCLFTGHSESLTGIKHNFKYIQPTIYVKP